MDAIHKGWFSELSSMWPGQGLSLEVEEILYHEKSKYQDVMVLQTYVYLQKLNSCTVYNIVITVIVITKLSEIKLCGR